MELDFERRGTPDLSPNTVLPERYCSKFDKWNKNGKLMHRHDVLRVKQGFTEISFRRYRSSSCKNIPHGAAALEGNVELKRGSIYQSSREVERMKKMGTIEERRKIELSRPSDTSFSLRIVDSLCSSDEESTKKRSPAMSVNSNLNPVPIQKPCIGHGSSLGFIEFCPKFDTREKLSTGKIGSELSENPKYRFEHIFGPLNDGNGLPERDAAVTFCKSLSKVEIPNSPSPSESDLSSGGSSKSRFSPFRKMFDPFMKSKSLRSPLVYMPDAIDVRTTGISNIRKKQTFRKSLFHDFSCTAQKSDLDSLLVEKDSHHLGASYSPVHLHGCLKLENKHGMPTFEFSLNWPGEVFVARTWKANNAFNWVYTFHSVCSRKKSNTGGLGLTNGNKESLVVGQMQVSCYLCTELKDGGIFDNSMMTEFVLYDTTYVRQSFYDQDSPDIAKTINGSSPSLVGGAGGSGDGSCAVKLKHLHNHSFDTNKFGSSNPYPLPSAILHPESEIAAIVIQLPFAKRESLKYKRGQKNTDKSHLNLLNLSMVEQKGKDFLDGESLDKLRVVIPTGNHGLPGGESDGPSSLLDRWRSGGGCDCGGWDMACPLSVLANPGIQYTEDQPMIKSQQPLELFFQGTKENTPALTMTFVKEGQYAVDFHAQLSALQAFSICVAILHGTVASSVTEEERNNPELPHCNSLKVLIEEEVNFLIEAVTGEKKVPKIEEEVQQSYVLNPPFSPISRV